MSLKAPSPILVKLSGIVIFVSPLQPENAEYPMLVTQSGIVIVVSLLQLENAEYPMLVTQSGIVMLVNPEHSEKAELSMIFPLVILTTKDVGLACLATALTFVAEPVILVSPLQPLKAKLPMVVTLSGIIMIERLVQPRKASSPMVVTLSGIIMRSSPLQLTNAELLMEIVSLFKEIEVFSGIVPLYL